MSGIKRFETDFSAISPKSQAQSGSINVFQRDNEVYIKAGEGSAHVLADRHCTPCSSAFEELQKLAADKKDGGLYAMAVEQTERRRKAMEQAALQIAGAMKAAVGGPANPFGVKPPGGEPGDSAALLLPPRVPKKDAVDLSIPDREVAQRARVAALYPESARAGTVAAMGPEERAARGIESDEETTHSIGDGHGHGGEEAKESDAAAAAGGHGHGGHSSESDLSEEELREVEELLDRDREVRAHEQAHKSVAGSHAGAISLSYRTGPDGKRYAVEGEVPVDLSPIANKPEKTIQKMRQIQRAALAPAEPSAADRRVASRAAQISIDAQAELLEMQREERAQAMKTAKGEPDAKNAEHDGAVEGAGSESTDASEVGPERKSQVEHAGPESTGRGGKRSFEPIRGGIRSSGSSRNAHTDEQHPAAATKPPKPAMPAAAVPGSFEGGR